MTLEYLMSERKAELQDNARVMSRGYRGPREGGPTVPTWDNLSIKKIKHSDELYPTRKSEIRNPYQ